MTAASVTVAWTIVANKPFYPLYAWWLIDWNAAIASIWTLAAMPLFAGLPFLAKRSGRAARHGLVLAGVADTFFASLMFGKATGAEYFLFPCLMLAALCFLPREKWGARAMAALVFVIFILLARFGGVGVHAITQDEAQAFARLNLYCAIALSTFVVLRFSGVPRDADEPPLDA